MKALNVKHYGAVGDGVTDDSAVIRSVIALAVADGGGSVYFPTGTFLVSAEGINAWCLNIPSNVRITGQTKENSVIKMADGQAGFTRVLYTATTEDVWIMNLCIDGNKANQTVEEHRAGIFATLGAKRLTISNVWSHDNSGDGIGIHGQCEDIIVYNCRCEDNDRSGVAIHGGDQNRVTVRNCQLINNVAQQLDTEFDPGSPAQNITVEGCHLVSLTDYAMTISGIDQDQQSDGFVIENNLIEGPVFMVWAKNVRFENNKILTRADDTTIPLDIFHHCENVIVKDNYIEYNATSEAINPRCIVAITGPTGDPADKPTNITLRGNILVTTQECDGIYISSMHSATIEDNLIVGTATTTLFGIELRPTDADADLQMYSVVIQGNHIIDFTKGIVASCLTGAETLKSLVVLNNTFEKVDNTGFTICLDLDADNNHCIRKATVLGNTSLGGITSMFGGSYGGWPVDVPTLIGGNAGDRGIYSCVGTPQGAIVENIGALAMDRAGTAYLKTADNGANTGWAAITHA